MGDRFALWDTLDGACGLLKRSCLAMSAPSADATVGTASCWSLLDCFLLVGYSKLLLFPSWTTRRSERVAGIEVPNYNENARLLSLADGAGEGGGRDRRLMRGAPCILGPLQQGVQAAHLGGTGGNCIGCIASGHAAHLSAGTCPTAAPNSRHACASRPAVADNISEEIYGVQHLDVLGSYQQEW